MRTKISAIIISNKDIDTSVIKTDLSFIEGNFDIKIVKPTDDLLKVLNEFRGFDCLLTIGDDLDLTTLNKLDVSVRKRWCHYDDVDVKEIGNIIIDVFKYNLKRKDLSTKTFSVFVSAYNTEKYKLKRLYDSLCSQTYQEWNLWILDDSSDGNTNVVDFVNEISDYRIHLFKNQTNHGNIGFNKHMIAMMCDGDYLFEMDHDDYLMPDCFELFNRAFVETNSDFVYSYVLELCGGKPVLYGDETGYWGFGEYGHTGFFNFNGVETAFAATPDINSVTIRTIYTQPNHPRCWKKEFYHKIGGHNTDLAVLDDQELLLKTFLNGTMCKVPKVLYIQDEGDAERGEFGSTAQSFRFKEIQRTTWLIKQAYDKSIHERVLDLGHKDPCWINEEQYSDLDIEHEPLPPINHILDI